MKVSMFHLMPHRELPQDFEKRYDSVWVTPPWAELADPVRVGQYYNWTLDELEFGAQMGFDGICVNEHHQNAYGFMPSPNIMASALARNTKDTAIVVMGSTLPTNPPQRIAEEYAMLDGISGGRLVAGMPLGSSCDVNWCYGITPIEQRERFREAHDLIIEAWTRKDVFAFNGKYNQLRYVNTWPKPIQQPHPPIWVPGTGSKSTVDWVAERDYCYCFLSYFGSKFAKKNVDKYWERLDELGKDANPYRLGFLQLVLVAETDAKAEEQYFEHVKYFYEKSLHTPLHFFMAPGHIDHSSLVKATRAGGYGIPADLAAQRKDWKFQDYIDNRFIVAGSPESVKQQLEDVIKDLNCGNLMALMHLGSMPHELTKKNIQIFGEEVLPKIRNIWDDQGWENHWWPQGAKRAEETITA
ncbi:MAG: Flavin-dependent oxidoreductase, luciferase family [Chloroflexi bacterium]|jgi:alkanesulfonate monooxygenase SsuD/methylene tetrahydromethanopterin reductase-like flavin-dependent oxidoreductase (luciferase family)|nr:MAG: Flavin-dependent oxidoreductase, luciferase family [Chloroflexota bacterium]